MIAGLSSISAPLRATPWNTAIPQLSAGVVGTGTGTGNEDPVGSRLPIPTRTAARIARIEKAVQSRVFARRKMVFKAFISDFEMCH